jgi:hypothetical protein
MSRLWLGGFLVPTILTLSAPIARAADFACPPPSEQVANDINVDINGSAQTFLKIGAAQVQGTVQKTVVDLFSKYPNADRVAIINTLISTTCNFVKSSTLSDNDKLNRWMAIYPAILTLMPPPQKSEVPYDLFHKITLGTTSLDYLTSLLGTANSLEYNDAIFLAGGYKITAHICCNSNGNYPKNAILKIRVEIDEGDVKRARDKIHFPYPFTENNDWQLGQLKIGDFCGPVLTVLSGIITNSSFIYSCDVGGTHADNFMYYTFITESDLQNDLHAQYDSDALTELDIYKEYIDFGTSYDSDVIKQIATKYGINKDNYNEKFMQVAQNLLITGFSERSSLANDDD